MSGERVEPRGTLQIEVKPVGLGAVIRRGAGEAEVGFWQAVANVRLRLLGDGGFPIAGCRIGRSHC